MCRRMYPYAGEFTPHGRTGKLPYLFLKCAHEGRRLFLADPRLISLHIRVVGLTFFFKRCAYDRTVGDSKKFLSVLFAHAAAAEDWERTGRLASRGKLLKDGRIPCPLPSHNKDIGTSLYGT